MRRSIIAAIALLALVPAAAAKEDPARSIRFCGAAGCRDITDTTLIRMLQASLWHGTPRGPAPPGPYYAIRLLDRTGRSIEMAYSRPLYYVPGPDALVRSSETIHWLALGAWAADYRTATRGLRPFPSPRVASATVGHGRPAADAQSYLRLYRLRGRRASDPAGLHPSITGDYGAGVATEYYARMRRHWIAVALWTSPRSPWGDDASFVWIGRTGSLLRRDSEVIRIDPRVARCVRLAVSLRSCPTG